MTEDQARALKWVAECFPRWDCLTHKPKTIGALLNRRTSELLEKYRGWHTFADGLKEHLADLAPRKLNSVIKWLDAQPLGALA
jgi:hypothetical protein